MAKNVSVKQTASEDNIPTAPVLGPAASRKVPQLISSTKSTRVVPVAPEEPEPWFDTEVTDSGDDNILETAAPQATPNPDPETDVPAEPANQYSSAPVNNQRPHWQQTQAVQPAPQQKKAVKKRHPFLKFLLVVLLLAAATYGAFWFGNHAAEKNNPTPQTTKPASDTSQQAAVTTKQYTSVGYSLNFNYPSNWTVTDATSGLTVVSPSMELPGLSGTAKANHIVITVQHAQSSLDDYPANGAVAALASTSLAYTRPSSDQRTTTSLSYLGYGKTDALDAIFITGDKTYQAEQTVLESDVIRADPLISVTFMTCTDQTCSSDTTPLTLQANAWQSLSVAKTVSAILASIQFK